MPNEAQLDARRRQLEVERHALIDAITAADKRGDTKHLTKLRTEADSWHRKWTQQKRDETVHRASLGFPADGGSAADPNV